jgi:hypothetical protein
MQAVWKKGQSGAAAKRGGGDAGGGDAGGEEGEDNTSAADLAGRRVAKGVCAAGGGMDRARPSRCAASLAANAARSCADIAVVTSAREKTGNDFGPRMGDESVRRSHTSARSGSTVASGASAPQSYNRFVIPPFEPEKMRSDAFTVINGPRNSGKSVLFEYLFMFLANKYFNVIAMTPTEDSVKMFERHIPQTNIYNSYDPEALKNAYKCQKTICTDIKERLVREGVVTKTNIDAIPEKYRRSLLIVLDDMMGGEKDVVKDETIDEIAVNGRHEWVGFMNMQQYIVSMSQKLRAQIDYLFLMQDSSAQNVEGLYNRFGKDMFRNRADFSRVYNEATSNYRCLVLDMKIRTKNPRDRLFSIKAAMPIPRYLACAPGIWYLCIRLARSNKEEREERKKIMATYGSFVRCALDGTLKRQADDAGAVSEPKRARTDRDRQKQEIEVVFPQEVVLRAPPDAAPEAAPDAAPDAAPRAAREVAPDSISVASVQSGARRRQAERSVQRLLSRKK